MCAVENFQQPETSFRTVVVTVHVALKVSDFFYEAHTQLFLIAPAFRMASPIIPINFLSEEDLKTIPNIGTELASAIVHLREDFGNLTELSLKTLFLRKIPKELLQQIDFTKNRLLIAKSLAEEKVNQYDLDINRSQAELDQMVESAQKEISERIDAMTSSFPNIPLGIKPEQLHSNTGKLAKYGSP